AGQGSNVLIDADTVIVLADQADVARVGGPSGVERYRERARIRGVEIARAWARADSESSQPIFQLAQSYGAAQMPDSALRVLERAMSRPATAVPGLRLALLAFQVSQGDTGAAGT